MLPPCHGGGLATSNWSCSIPGPPPKLLHLGVPLGQTNWRGGWRGCVTGEEQWVTVCAPWFLRAGGWAPFHLLSLTPAPFGLT